MMFRIPLTLAYSMHGECGEHGTQKDSAQSSKTRSKIMENISSYDNVGIGTDSWYELLRIFKRVYNL